MRTGRLIEIGVVLTAVNIVVAMLPHYNIFEGAWQPANLSYFDVTLGEWAALFCVWFSREKPHA
jgi:hypothetical protein